MSSRKRYFFRLLSAFDAVPPQDAGWEQEKERRRQSRRLPCLLGENQVPFLDPSDFPEEQPEDPAQHGGQDKGDENQQVPMPELMGSPFISRRNTQVASGPVMAEVKMAGSQILGFFTILGI